MNTAEILYREFYDVPRIFVVNYKGLQILFDSPFDEVLDDYPDDYKVFVLPNLQMDELSGSWVDLPKRAIRYLGNVPVREVVFDPSKRKWINTGIIDDLLNE